VRVRDFHYEFPEELIANAPTAERDGARLLVLDADRNVDSQVRSLAGWVTPGTVIVVNDTRVVKARLRGQKETGGRVELFFLASTSATSFHAIGKSSKPLRNGMLIRLGGTHGPTVRLSQAAAAVDGDEMGAWHVQIVESPALTVEALLETYGQVPLPPYIKREAAASDSDRYQTIFAREQHDDGAAVAAPTAGLHLTHERIRELEAKGCIVAPITLHVGLGTFQSVRTDDFDTHPMHSESYSISASTVRVIAEARVARRPVLAIGTTSVRALESAADLDNPGHVRQTSHADTRLLIQPGYRFQVVDALFTNFHLPESTLLALVCAFGGTERVLSAYREAVAKRYRLFSYGDAMLLRTRQPLADTVHPTYARGAE
jgi:S-adenosylmethionine:tRNA ribosyltransferase-isomerase